MQMAVLLVVSAEERRRRLLGRGEELTEEETKLDKSKLFQERLVVVCWHGDMAIARIWWLSSA